MSNCLYCAKVNPPSKGRRKRKYCSKPCANKYLQEKNYNNGEGGVINGYTYIKKNPNWGSKTRELNERRTEFEQCEADPNLFSPKDFGELSVSQVSMRGKFLEIEPVKTITYSGHRTYYSKDQMEKITNCYEILNQMKEEGGELPTAYLKYSKERSEYGKNRRRKLFEERKNNPIALRAHSKSSNKRWLYRKDRADKHPHVKLARNVSYAVWVACKKQGSSKGGSTWKTLPYTSKELQQHLESQWEEWMTWENYGTKWNIDHIIPQSKLIYDSVHHPNFLPCWSLANLQPLCVYKNRSKGSYYEGRRYCYD